MKKFKKDDIIKDISDKEIYDIDYYFALKAAENINFTQCNKYSTYHYKTILVILRSKLETMSNKDDKLAYLNCLSVNYASLSITDAFDIFIGLLSGSCIGVSFFSVPGEIISKVLAIILIVFFLILKVYVLTTRKWSFYENIIEQLKNEIE